MVILDINFSSIKVNTYFIHNNILCIIHIIKSVFCFINKIENSTKNWIIIDESTYIDDINNSKNVLAHALDQRRSTLLLNIHDHRTQYGVYPVYFI